MTTINTQEELLRALRENPEWRDAVRGQILGEELLQLPARFDAFVQTMNKFVEGQTAFNQQMTAFIKHQEAFNQQVTAFMEHQEAFNQRTDARLDRMDAFIEHQEAFNQSQEAFNRRTDARFDRMEGTISDIKSTQAEDKAVESSAHMALLLNLNFVKTLSQADIIQLYQESGKTLERNVENSFIRADLIIETKDGEQTVYVPVEVSWTADIRDSGRAQRNAALLTEFTGHRAIPAVASVRNDHDVAALIESGAIFWYELEAQNTRIA